MTLLLFIFLLILPDASICLPIDDHNAVVENAELRAVSLKVIQDRLKAAHKTGSFSAELLQFGFLTRVDGYIADQANHDIILFGQADSNLPPLYLEDFVITLRNAWLKYAPLRGNTYEYSYPGCSIDPNSATIQRLQGIGQRIANLRSSAQVESQLKDWHRTCKEPQSVRVMGIPFDSRFGQVMVKADYDMKTLVDGSDSLDIPGFGSLTGMKLNQIRKSILSNQPITVSVAGLNRFWFFPGQNLYEEDQGTVLIQECPVTLLTEEMYVGARGGIVSGGSSDPLAQKFAEGFTALYDKVAAERLIYVELENLFRFVALAKIVKFRDAHAQAGLNLKYLLEEFPVSQTPVKRHLPGRSAVKEFQHRRDFQGGYQIAQLWLPSCGGVGIELPVTERQFVKNTSGVLGNLKSKLLNARPSANSLYWDYRETTPGGPHAAIQYSSRVRRINRRKKYSTTLTLVDTKTGFEVYAGKNDPSYTGNDLHKMASAITDRMGKDLQGTIYLDTKDMPLHKLEGIATTLAIDPTLKARKIEVKVFSRQAGGDNLQEAFLSRGITLSRQPSQVERVTTGKFANWYRITLEFATKISGKLVRLTVEVFARTLALAQAFQKQIESHFSTEAYETRSVSELLNKFRKDLQREHGDFIFKLQDETGQTQIVVLPRMANRATS